MFGETLLFSLIFVCFLQPLRLCRGWRTAVCKTAIKCSRLTWMSPITDIHTAYGMHRVTMSHTWTQTGLESQHHTSHTRGSRPWKAQTLCIQCKETWFLKCPASNFNESQTPTLKKCQLALPWIHVLSCSRRWETLQLYLHHEASVDEVTFVFGFFSFLLLKALLITDMNALHPNASSSVHPCIAQT